MMGKIGVMVELGCETDFVAKNEDFQALIKDIAMQIAAMNPRYISEKDIPAAVLDKEKEIYREQLKSSGKPAAIIEKIVEGKLGKFYADACLLQQNFFKDEKLTIEKLIAEKIHKTGENIVVKRFTRYQMGEEL
jgi:elongation factor Ts